MRGWLIGVAAALIAVPAFAQLDTSTSISTSGGDMNWTATAARTVGMNNGVVHVDAGWPGIGFSYLRGLDERTDLGVHVGFNYGLEGTHASATGLNLAVPVRRTISDAGMMTVALEASPGLSIYGNNGSALVGIGGPVGVVAGWRVDPRLTLDLGADMPILLSFANPTGLLFGPQFGGGAEYLIDRNIAVTFQTRVGPEFALASGGTGSTLGFNALVGVAYNTR